MTIIADAMLRHYNQLAARAEGSLQDGIARADAADAYLERIRTAMGGYKDSDLASLAETLRVRNDALEVENERLRAERDSAMSLYEASMRAGTLAQAVDENLRLEAENERLRAALATYQRRELSDPRTPRFSLDALGLDEG